MTDSRTWLLLVHHLPTRPTRLRVRVWRQIQRLGALPVKNSVYVLPWSDVTLEDFTWLQQEIRTGGGEAVIFRASAVAGMTDDEIVAAFRRDRDAAYQRLAADLEELADRLKAAPAEGADPARGEAFEKEIDTMQNDYTAIVEVDFFEAPARERAAAGLKRCRTLLRSGAGKKGAASPARIRRADPSRYMGRLWVTRPRPHIDRCASAWLIRRFIDPRARFAFAAEGDNLRGGIAYDMNGAEFGHRGEDCTFETLMKEFGLDRDAGVKAIAEIVHDIDLKDGKFGRAEAGGVNAVLRGLSDRVRDDRRLLRETEAVFDGLHATLSAATGSQGAPRRRK